MTDTSQITEERKISYDPEAIFISYSPEDIDWAEDELRPLLESRNIKVITPEDLITGGVAAINRERAIADTRRTIVVLTPEWITNQWNQFEADMLATLDPAAAKRKLLPVMLRKTAIPPRIASLTVRDLTNQGRNESRLNRLITHIEDVVPVPPAEEFERRWEWYWRQARRRGVTPGRLAALAVLFFLWTWMSIALPPFHSREIWAADAYGLPGAVRLHNAGSVLVAGGENTGEGCLQDMTGIWYRAIDGDVGQDGWQSSEVEPPNLLCVRDASGLAGIVDIDSLPNSSKAIYALTDVAGLLVSTDNGATFHGHPSPFPLLRSNDTAELLAVGGTQTAPLLWVAGTVEGLWRSKDDDWLSIEGIDERCTQLASGRVTSLWAEGVSLLAGTDQNGLWLVDDNTCRQVMSNPAGGYVFLDLNSLQSSSHLLYLALVEIRYANRDDPLGKYQLLVICPWPDSCTEEHWEISEEPLWSSNNPPSDLAVQIAVSGEQHWYVANDSGRVWRGTISAGRAEALPRLWRCFWLCGLTLATADELPPFLLVSQFHFPSLRVDANLYTLARREWWRWFYDRSDDADLVKGG